MHLLATSSGTIVHTKVTLVPAVQERERLNLRYLKLLNTTQVVSSHAELYPGSYIHNKTSAIFMMEMVV